MDDHPIDFLFIDGDHTYAGVRQDWEQYSPLVRSGGLIASHDEAMNYQDTHVAQFWNEIKGGLKYTEYIYQPSARLPRDWCFGPGMSGTRASDQFAKTV